MTAPLLSLHGVTLRYPGREQPVLANISFDAHEGERIALLGDNGSGKTTLLLAITGLLEHTGEMFVDGIPVTGGKLREVREKIGFLFSTPEDQILFPGVLEDVAFALTRKGVSAEEAFKAALEALRVLDAKKLAERSVHELSHGERLRVALAGALISKPPLLLLDEPTASLDVPGKRHLAGVLRSLPSASLLATHDLQFAQAVCTRFIQLRDGTIEYDSREVSGLEAEWEV